jgi:hypothetical protein
MSLWTSARDFATAPFTVPTQIASQTLGIPKIGGRAVGGRSVERLGARLGPEGPEALPPVSQAITAPPGYVPPQRRPPMSLGDLLNVPQFPQAPLGVSLPPAASTAPTMPGMRGRQLASMFPTISPDALLKLLQQGAPGDPTSGGLSLGAMIGGQNG